MTKKMIAKAVLAAAALAAMALPSAAQMADIHDQRRERGLICFTDHYHYGTSTGMASKAAATSSAIRSWADFVDFEYGGRWTSWGASGSKSIKCSRGGGSWGCDVSSRPCRR